MTPLHGMRVLALEQYYAGNIGSLMFARFGAEVIKVELPEVGDLLREAGPQVKIDGRRRSNSELRTMGGKKSIELDLHNPKGLDVMWRLAERSDVVWTNMKPSSLEGLGITFETLRARNPNVVYTTLSGFGHDDLVPDGPFGDWPAFDLIAQGLAGIQFRAEGVEGRPGYNGLPIGDNFTAMLAVLGTSMALLRRIREPGAQRVDVAMHDAMLFMNELPLGLTAFTGKAPPRGRSGTSAPYGSYRASDGFVNVCVAGDAIWRRFCEATGRPELVNDERFANPRARVNNYLDVDAVVEEWTTKHTALEAAEILRRHAVPSGPVYDLPQVVQSAQVHARNMMIDLEDPVAGPRRIIGNPIKMSDVNDKWAELPHDLGADTHAILRELGLSEEERLALVAAKAVGPERRPHNSAAAVTSASKQPTQQFGSDE